MNTSVNNPVIPAPRPSEPAPVRTPPANPSSVSRPRTGRREEAIRREALGLAVQFANGPNVSGNAEAVVNTAKSFEAFLAGTDTEAGK